MSCKSFMFVENTSPSTLALTAAQPSATVPVGSVLHGCGCDRMGVSGNALRVCGRGYFKVDANVTVTPLAAGNITLALLKDGVPVTGATQTSTATAGLPVGLNVPAIVRQCCDSSSLLTLAVSTTAALPTTLTVNNVGVTVEKE